MKKTSNKSGILLQFECTETNLSAQSFRSTTTTARLRTKGHSQTTLTTREGEQVCTCVLNTFNEVRVQQKLLKVRVQISQSCLHQSIKLKNLTGRQRCFYYEKQCNLLADCQLIVLYHQAFANSHFKVSILVLLAYLKA